MAVVGEVGSGKVCKILFNLKSSQMSKLALSGAFEYLCYWSTTIMNSFTLSVRGSITSERFRRIKMVPALQGLIIGV